MSKTIKKQIFLPNTIPKYLLKAKSKCRRKLYRLIRAVENIYLISGYKKYINKNERNKIKAGIYLFFADELNCSISKLQFKSMDSSQYRRLSILLDSITPDDVVYWIKDNQCREEYNKQIRTILNGE